MFFCLEQSQGYQCSRITAVVGLYCKISLGIYLSAIDVYREYR